MGCSEQHRAKSYDVKNTAKNCVRNRLHGRQSAWVMGANISVVLRMSMIMLIILGTANLMVVMCSTLDCIQTMISTTISSLSSWLPYLTVSTFMNKSSPLSTFESHTSSSAETMTPSQLPGTVMNCASYVLSDPRVMYKLGPTGIVLAAMAAALKSM